jgi:serine/threonine protein kinase
MSSPRPTLVIEVLTPGAQLGDRYVVHPDQKILLGRTRNSDLVFDHPTVTQRHAWIWFERGQWLVRDAGSAGGTFIDDRSVPYSAEPPLRSGSTLRLGGFDLLVTEGAPDLEPSIVGSYPRDGGEAAERVPRAGEVRRPRPPKAPRFAGRFVLHEQIGRGNQGVVHRAHDDETKGFVALKVFDPIEDAALIERFLAQKKVNALRYGVWIQKHLAWGVVDRAPYLAMELSLGERLSDRLKQRPLTMKEAVEVVRSLASGAGDLHQEGLSHRNIKPDNIRFSQYLPTSPALSDIWVDTDRRGEPPYRRELLAASLGFVAPERLRTGEADARADVYSLAAVLYRCVTGCLPIADHEAAGAYGRLGPSGSDPPQPLAELRPDAPRALCDLLEAALSPYPGDRPANGKDLSFALRDVEKALGLAGAEPPFPITRTARGRRAAPRGRPPIDPFTDKVFQEELKGLVLPRCNIDRARSHLHTVLGAVHHAERAKLSGCALCGTTHFNLPCVEVQPDGCFLMPNDAESRARRPYLCYYCTWGEHRAAHAALTETLADLAAHPDAQMRPGGPTRRELREGLLRLVDDARPHFDDHAVCTRCARRDGALVGAELNLCLSCVASVRAAAEAQMRATATAHQEHIRAAYEELYVRAEARLVRVGKRPAKPSPRPVPLPPKGSIGDWFYLDVEEVLRAAAPTQARVDEVGAKLASSLEAHVIGSLEKRLEKDALSPFETQGTSGLPSHLERYLAGCRPSKPLADRLDMAIAVMSELLRAGYRYTHMLDECEWGDATGYFEVFHALADRPPR